MRIEQSSEDRAVARVSNDRMALIHSRCGQTPRAVKIPTGHDGITDTFPKPSRR
jgi:hypothetical protein